MRISDWSSDVCSSDLEVARSHALGRAEVVARGSDGDERAKADVEGASNEILLVVDDHGDPTIRCGLHAVAIGVPHGRPVLTFPVGQWTSRKAPCQSSSSFILIKGPSGAPGGCNFGTLPALPSGIGDRKSTRLNSSH